MEGLWTSSQSPDESPCILQSRIFTPSPTASIAASDWSDPDSPVEGAFHVNEGWHASEDTVWRTLARHFRDSWWNWSDSNDNWLDDSTPGDYKYEPAFSIDACVRIQGQENSKWAKKDGSGRYWSKKLYRVADLRCTADVLGQGFCSVGQSSDDHEDEYSEDSDDEMQDGQRNRKHDARNTPSYCAKGSSPDTKFWYYKLDMSSEDNEHPLADATWWAEDQLVLDTEADWDHEDQMTDCGSGIEDDDAKEETVPLDYGDQEMTDEKRIQDDFHGEVAIATLSLNFRGCS
ncbi:hypothetical protein LTR84_005377 [Exophiala bonariae]|uniref:Uncharacterized protein n=1 Tax=Exophiala bonariae TaxID=1690606 RepID=A0AAV9N4F8_9EURO|nr:hypothetical protein LTR84_005377 [Exophiala bonariae]